MTYQMQDSDAAIRNLNDLLDVICDLQFDQEKEKRDVRIDSLLWIARDLSDGIIHQLDEGITVVSMRREA